MAHIEPLSYDELPDDLKAKADAAKARMGFTPNSLMTLLRKPKIAVAYTELQRAIFESMTFPQPLRSMMFHLMSNASGCRYCQVHGIHLMSKNPDMPAEKLDELWEFETSDKFNEAEKAALRFAFAAGQVPNGVTDAHFGALKEHFSEEQIVEMVAWLCMGAWLNRWNDTMATTLEEEPLGDAIRMFGGKGWQPGKHAEAGAAG